MIRLYLESEANTVFIEKKNALPASETQVLEIFSGISSTQAVKLGLILENQDEIQITPFNNFIWEVKTYNHNKVKEPSKYLSTQGVIFLIKEIFQTPA